MFRSTVLLACLAPFAITVSAAADEQDKPVALKVGDKAPKFAGRTDEDKPWRSKDHVGKKVLVVYFYPADMTGGCTAQACNYRDALEKEFDRDQVEVIGVSGDSVENHAKFKKAHDLNFTLLADPEGKIAKAFGVKTGEGGVVNVEHEGEQFTLERGVTTGRWTFIIDLDGQIAHKDDKVNAAKDTEKAQKVVEKLTKSKAEKPKAG
jgi:thioredoxin-dependent peroxiredoxin